MKRTLAVTCLLWMFVWAGLGVWGACPANNPNNPFAITMQGGDPTGNAGYPIAVVGATGCPLDVNVVGGGGNCVTQCTSPWVVSGTVMANQGTNPWVVQLPNTFVIPSAFSGFQGLIDPVPALPGVAAWQLIRNESDGRYYPPRSPDINSGSGTAAGYAGSIQMVANTGGGMLNTIADPASLRQFPLATAPGSHALSTAGLLCTGTQDTLHGWEAERTPTTFKTVTAAAAGNTAAWTPTAGFKFRLMRYQVIVTDNATQAAPGTLTVSLNDAGAALNQVHPVFVPAIGLVNSGSLYSSPWIDLGNGQLSAATNNVLNVNLSAALTAGQVQVNLCGTEE